MRLLGVAVPFAFLLPVLAGLVLLSCDEERHEYALPVLEYASAVQPLADGGFAVTGASFYNGEAAARVLVACFDTEGQSRWSREYDLGTDMEGSQIQAVLTGGFLVLCASRYPYDGPELRVLKLSADGGIEWEREIPACLRVFTNAIPTPDGGFAAYGVAATAGWGGTALLQLAGDVAVEFCREYGDTVIAEAAAPATDGSYLL